MSASVLATPSGRRQSDQLVAAALMKNLLPTDEVLMDSCAPQMAAHCFLMSQLQ